jgi:hypothetical protein
MRLPGWRRRWPWPAITLSWDDLAGRRQAYSGVGTIARLAWGTLVGWRNFTIRTPGSSKEHPVSMTRTAAEAYLQEFLPAWWAAYQRRSRSAPTTSPPPEGDEGRPARRSSAE